MEGVEARFPGCLVEAAAEVDRLVTDNNILARGRCRVHLDLPEKAHRVGLARAVVGVEGEASVAGLVSEYTIRLGIGGE